MNSSLLRIALAVALALVAGTPWTSGQELDEPLKMLEPLVHKTWTGGYMDGPETGLKFIDTWTVSLGGKAIQRRREIPERSFASEYIFYWDREKGSIAFLGLSTRGIVNTGTVSREGDLIVVRGRSVRSEGDVEFKNTMEILPDGKLRDYYYALHGDTWVQYHHQEFTPQASAAGGS